MAEELHFTRAAERLHLAQPALSQHIKRLERDVGARLFERTRRAVTLTAAGRALLRYSGAVVGASDAARSAVARAAGGQLDTIAIGFVETTGAELLGRAVRTFRARSPEVGIDLRESTEGLAAVTVALREGRLDIALGHHDPIGVDGIDVELVLSEPFTSVALPAGHRLAGKRTLTLGDLRHERFVMGRPRSRYTLRLLAACAALDFTPELVPAGDPATRMVLVAAGAGVVLLLRSHPRFESADILYRKFRDDSMSIDLFAMRRSGESSPHVLSFMDALRAARKR